MDLILDLVQGDDLSLGERKIINLNKMSTVRRCRVNTQHFPATPKVVFSAQVVVETVLAPDRP